MSTLKVKVTDFPLSLEVEKEQPKPEKFHIPAKPVVQDWNAKQIKMFGIMVVFMIASIFGFWLMQ